MEEDKIRESIEDLWEKEEKAGNHNCVPFTVKKLLSGAFNRIPASKLPLTSKGKVLEIKSDETIAKAIEFLAENQIYSAPVRDASAKDAKSWSDRYLGMIDYSAIVLWVIEQAELAAATLSASMATASGVGAGALGGLGMVALGLSGPFAVAGVAAAAVGAAVAGGIAVNKGIGKDPQTAADTLGDEFYKLLLSSEPYASTKVADVALSYKWGPFIPVQSDDSLLSIMLLMSKYRLRSVAIVEPDNPYITNLITQSALIKGFAECRGFEWFDAISERTLQQLGLPLMQPNEVICIDADSLILEAFMIMRDKDIGGLPVTEGGDNKLFANISITDIQHLLLHPELFHRRKFLTVRDFVATVSKHAKMIGIKGKAILGTPITCTCDTTLISIILKLTENEIHRIHVVDSKGSIQGIVTLHDIISCFVMEPKDHMQKHFGQFASH